VRLVLVNKTEGESFSIGVRSIDDSATNGVDYKGIDMEIIFELKEKEKAVDIEIIDDDQWEPDVDFYVEVYDLSTKQRLEGVDTCCKVTIIDDDEPGVLSFESRHVKVRGKDKLVQLKVLRQQGCDGVVKCQFETFIPPNSGENTAVPYEDFVPVKGTLVFQSGETEKVVEVQINEKEEDEEDGRDDLFAMRIFEPEGGAKVTKKDICYVNIVGDSELVEKVQSIEKMLKMMEANESKGWKDQITGAIVLTPQLDEEGKLEEVSVGDALLHFA